MFPAGAGLVSSQAGKPPIILLPPSINHDLEGSLWYTGSTIAQTLSASMGLLGAIMLFSLQEAARSIARAAQQLAEQPHPRVNAAYIKHVLARRSFHELARLYGQVLENPDQMQGTSVELLAHHATLTWELDHDTVVRKAFRTALKSSGVMIALSIMLTGAAPYLASYEQIGWILLVVAILGALGCLLLYGLLLRMLFRAQAEVKPEPATRN